MISRPLAAYLASLISLLAVVQTGLGLWRFEGRPDAWFYDAYEYFDAAVRWYWHGLTPHPTRPFGWPALSGWSVWFTESFDMYLRVAYVLNVAAFVATGVLLWRLGAVFAPAGSRLRRLPAWLFAVQAGSLIEVGLPMTETCYTLLLVAACAAWKLAPAQRYARGVLAAWLLLCFSAVVRPAGIYFVAVLGPALIVFFYLLKHNFLWRTALLLLAFALTAGLQIARMHAVYHTTRLSYIDSLTYHLYADAYAAGWTQHSTWAARAAAWRAENTRRRQALGLEEPQRAALLAVGDWPALAARLDSAARQTWQRQPQAVLGTLARNLASNALGGSVYGEYLYRHGSSPGRRGLAGALFWLSRLQNAAYTAVLLAMCGAGLYRAARPRRYDCFLLVAGGFAVVTLLASSVSFVGSPGTELEFAL